METLTVFDHVLAVVFLLVLPLHAVFRGQPAAKEVVFDRGAKIGMYWGSSIPLWISTGLIAGVWWWSDRSYEQLGFGTLRPEGELRGAILLAAIVVWYGVDAFLKMRTPDKRAETRARWRRDSPFMPATGGELAHSLVLILTAAVCEEVLFRGFAIFYFRAWFGLGPVGTAIAVGIPAAVFGFAHMYQGKLAAVQVAGMAILFGTAYLAFGCLWPLIALHFAVDLVSSALGVWVIRINADRPTGQLPPYPTRDNARGQTARD